MATIFRSGIARSQQTWCRLVCPWSNRAASFSSTALALQENIESDSGNLRIRRYASNPEGSRNPGDLGGDESNRRKAKKPRNRGFGPDGVRVGRKAVRVDIDEKTFALSPILLRDLDESPRSIDPSTRQKLFLTTDIPPTISSRGISYGTEGVTFHWNNGLASSEDGDPTFTSWESLRALVSTGTTEAATSRLDDLPRRAVWTAEEFTSATEDISYEQYMSSDATLLAALNQLHTHGLLFLTDVPDSEDSVSRMAERIGPLKNTFYGNTWDVRSVPDAKNVAYTSQDLGFHMDLLYMEQPPHLQLLHCIRSSASGGASLFTDAFRSVTTLFEQHIHWAKTLASFPVKFHYKHESSHVYNQRRQVIDFKLSGPGGKLDRIESTLQAASHGTWKDDGGTVCIADLINNVSWSPPFQAPFSSVTSGKLYDIDILGDAPGLYQDSQTMLQRLNRGVEVWYSAASEFNKLIHRPEGVHERMMKPGECVIFDNRRVLHARRAFEVGDAGKERWLRGAYVDKDPYLSKMSVLRHQLRVSNGT